MRLPLSRRSALILFALVFLALALDFLFFTGLYGSDDIFYVNGARAIAGDGTFVPELGNVRLGITLPDALVYGISGSIGAIAWFHVAYHLGLVVVAYVLGRLLHGERTGFIAAALTAINPLLYGFAGAVLPDNATAFWLGATMIALVCARRSSPGVHLLSWNKDRFIGYLVSGVLLGICYACKETALVMTVPVAVFIMTAGPSFRSLVWIQNGAVVVFGLVILMVLERVALRVVAGEWISRFTMLSDASKTFIAEMNGTETPFARVHYAYVELKAWAPLTMWLLAGGSVAYGFLKSRSAGIVMWFWWPLLYLTVGSASFTSYVPPVIQTRYYAITVLPAIVMTAAVISELMQRWHESPRGTERSRRIGPHLIVGAALSFVGMCELRSNAPQSGNLYHSPELRAFVGALEIAHERYPGYPIAASSEYWGRARPIAEVEKLYQDPMPAPPFLFVDIIDRVDDARAALQTPTSCARRLHDVLPARSRMSVLADAVRRMVGVTPRKPIRVVGDRYAKSGAGLILVEARRAGEPCGSTP